MKSPYERSALTPPNRNRPVYTVKPGSSSVSSLVKAHVNSKSKKTPYGGGGRKTNLLDKRSSVFNHIYVAKNKPKKCKDINTYNLIDNGYFDLNKTFDMMNSTKMHMDGSDGVSRNKLFKNSFTQHMTTKNAAKPYINSLLDTTPISGKSKDSLVKQKPAAPEIKRKIPITITNMNTSMSDSSMIQYSNVSSIKFFNRPKSVERIKRKPAATKKKQAKSKPRKKVKKKLRQDGQLFDPSSSLNIANVSSNTSMYRRAKLEEDIDKLCKIKPPKFKETRNFKQSKLLSTNSHVIPRKQSKASENIFDRKMSSMPKGKTKLSKKVAKLENDLLIDMMSSADPSHIPISKDKLDSKRDHKKCKTKPTSNNQTIKLNDKSNQNVSSKNSQLCNKKCDSPFKITSNNYNSNNDNYTQPNSQKLTSNAVSRSSDKMEVFTKVLNSGCKLSQKITGSTKKEHQDRQNVLSFGPFPDTHNNQSEQQVGKSLIKTTAGNDQAKIIDDEDKLSLLSYQESEKHDDKYYDADELVDILDSQIDGKSKSEKGIKSQF